MELVGAQAVLFYILAIVTLLMAFSLITARSAVHAALFLMATLVGVAGLFLLLHAEFVAGAQILIYVGGVVVLFIFVIMLVNVREELTEATRPFTRQHLAGYILVAGMVLSVVFFGIKRDPNLVPRPSVVAKTEDANASITTRVSADTQLIGESLYVQAALPFEIASLLLLVAIVGSVLLARSRRQEEKYD